METAAAMDGPAKARRHWPLERVLFSTAGTVTLLSALLAATLTPWFLLLTVFVGLNQLAFAAFGNCPSSWLLQRYGGFERGVPR